MRLISLIFALVIISALLVYYSNTNIKPDTKSEQTVKQQTQQVLDEAKRATEEMQKALEKQQKRFEELEEK